LWETTIGLREDSEAEKFLDNENAQRATAVAATAKRQEVSARALSSGELKSQEAKRSVFTARESAPTIQRHVDISGRGPQRIGLIALLSAAAVAIGIGAYVLLHKTSDPTSKLTTSIPNAAPNRITPDTPASVPGAPTSQANELAAGAAKSTSTANGTNGAITRKEALSPGTATDAATAKPKADAAKLPARKPVPAESAATAESSRPKISAPAPLPVPPEHDVAPASQQQESATPVRTDPIPAGVSPAAEGEPDARAQSLAEPEPEPADAAPAVPTFTDAPRVN
jgi:hypothetical protein